MKPEGVKEDLSICIVLIVANFYPLANVIVFRKISCNERSNIYE